MKMTQFLDPESDIGTNKFLLKKAAMKNAELLISAVANYSEIHQELFGKYEGELMHPPDAYLLYHNLSGTFQDFLVRENLTILTPLLELLHTAQGYGYLDEVGTIYGLMWNTPELLISATLRLLEADQEPYSFFAFKEGFEKIWSTIVETEKLEVEYNTQIVNIARSHHGTYIHYTVGDGIYLKLDWCDFLIWTPPMTELLKVLSTAASPEEHHYFGHLHPEIYSVSLMSATSPFEDEEEAHTYYLENLVNKTNHGVIADLQMTNVFDGSELSRKKRSWDNFASLKNRRGKSLSKKRKNWSNTKKKKQNKATSSTKGRNSFSDQTRENQGNNERQNQSRNGRTGKQNPIKPQSWNETKKVNDNISTSRAPKQGNKRANRRGKQTRRQNGRRGKQTRQRKGKQGRGKGSTGDNVKVVYQIGKNYTSEAEINKLAKSYFSEGFDYTDIELFNTKSWPYFYRWSPYEVMKGNHWDVFALQGFHRTWYAGASVCFESVKSVMEYNSLLLRQSLYQELPLPTPDGKVSTTADTLQFNPLLIPQTDIYFNKLK